MHLSIHSSPKSQNTSEWTLDYPPFFAYFEWILSQIAQYVDPQILDVGNLGYESWQVIYFQRSTVIGAEVFLVYALHKYLTLFQQH